MKLILLLLIYKATATPISNNQNEKNQSSSNVVLHINIDVPKEKQNVQVRLLHNGAIDVVTEEKTGEKTKEEIEDDDDDEPIEEITEEKKDNNEAIEGLARTRSFFDTSSENDKSMVSKATVMICNSQKQGSCYQTSVLSANGFNFIKNPDQVYQIRFLSGEISVLFQQTFGYFPSLTKLSLDSVNLDLIEPNAFSRIPNLQSLSLQNNNLLALERDVFHSLHSLKFLNLDHNSIEAIAKDVFAELVNLEAIHLSYNRLETFDPFWFQKNWNLKNYHFAYNQIKALESNVFKWLSLDDMVNFDFNDNEIERVGKDMFSEKHKGSSVLGVLSLRNNRIECFEGNVTDFLKASIMHLDGNPLKCGCIQRILDVIAENKRPKVTFTGGADCVYEIN